MITFGTRSMSVRASLHQDWQAILDEFAFRAIVDIALIEGHRTVATQQKYFKEGKSTKDGIFKKSKHQSMPSLAVDIMVWHKDRDLRHEMKYDHVHLAFVAGQLITTAENLLNRGLITHRVRWGGDWDRDGVLMFDQTLQDLVHFELIPA